MTKINLTIYNLKNTQTCNALHLRSKQIDIFESIFCNENTNYVITCKIDSMKHYVYVCNSIFHNHLFLTFLPLVKKLIQ